MITVMIATNRGYPIIHACITSILHSTHNDFEIIVIDQSNDTSINWSDYRKDKRNRIQYIHANSIGKSKALNLGFKYVRSDIIAFTDDDCMVDKNWLTRIHESFQYNPHIVGVFGKTLAYQPEKHVGLYCPCTFNKPLSKIISRPCRHWEKIGFGNNMAFRKDIFTKLGGFKSWLGPGSIARAAMDAEFALRVLICGKQVAYNPRAIIYHNKWLTPEEKFRQNLSYCCGEMSCYGYFFFHGYQFASSIFFDNFKDSFHKTKQVLKAIILFRWSKKLLKDIYSTGAEILYGGRGLVIGFIFALIDPIV